MNNKKQNSLGEECFLGPENPGFSGSFNFYKLKKIKILDFN